MSLRRATEEDLPQIQAVFEAPGNLDKLEGYDAATLCAALTAPDQRFWVWQGSAAIAGFIWVTGVDDEQAKIEEFAATAPGSGVGRALLQAALDHADLAGKRIWLKVAADNEGAIRFYERFGFAVTHVQPAAWARRSGDVADAATMVRTAQAQP